VTVLVFGRNGQVATALQRQAAASGQSLLAMGHGEIDVLDIQALREAVSRTRPTAVINAAAYTAVDKAETEREAAFALNAEAPGLMAGICAERGLPFVHLSTDYVFDGSKPAPYRENDPLAPLGVYGASKAEGEARVLGAHPQAVVLRTAWVYFEQGQNFVRTMLRFGRERDEMRIVSDQRGNPTYAVDIADACLTIAGRGLTPASPSGVFHYAGQGAASWFDFASAIFEEAASVGRRVPAKLVPIATADYPTPAKRPANSQLDCARLERELGIKTQAWRERLQTCIAKVVD
jgi:dTDP-4-dehydrorhamnose reductase